MKGLGVTFGGLPRSGDLSLRHKIHFSVSLRYTGMLTLPLFDKNSDSGLLIILMPTILYTKKKNGSLSQILCSSIVP